MANKFKPNKIEPDQIYSNVLVAKFINHLMTRGKKSIARGIVYNSFDLIKKQTNREPIEVFEGALKNAMPQIEVRPQRVGGATYQVPREVKEKRAVSLAMRWLIDAARAKKGKPMAEKLAAELMQAGNNEGEAIKKKVNVHKMAEANRAFAYLAR
ncbi:MAG: 30S ribosomal protein S7 [Candidatus Pacebacteria bacterium]|nr:30S ribosomal protein S7 [Candidatus Paceibacterota bacterium]